MNELAPDLIRRVLVVMQFANCEGLFWREDAGVLTIFALCSDFFAWGCADCESIETAEDVALLERCRDELAAAVGAAHPLWIGELYAARRRGTPPDAFMLTGKYALDPRIQHLFPVAASSSAVSR